MPPKKKPSAKKAPPKTKASTVTRAVDKYLAPKASKPSARAHHSKTAEEEADPSSSKAEAEQEDQTPTVKPGGKKATATGAKQTGGSTRVLRRRRDEVTPQKTPEWQSSVLAIAAANQSSPNAKAPRGKKASGAGKKGSAKRKRSDSADDGGSDVSFPSVDDDDDVDNDSDSSYEEPRKRRRKASSASTASSPSGSPTSPRRRLKKAELQCGKCKLPMDEWPFCGLTGDAHQLPIVA